MLSKVMPVSQVQTMHTVTGECEAASQRVLRTPEARTGLISCAHWYQYNARSLSARSTRRAGAEGAHRRLGGE